MRTAIGIAVALLWSPLSRALPSCTDDADCAADMACLVTSCVDGQCTAKWSPDVYGPTVEDECLARLFACQPGAPTGVITQPLTQGERCGALRSAAEWCCRRHDGHVPAMPARRGSL